MLNSTTLRSRKITLSIIISIFFLLFLFIKLREINLRKHGILLNAKTLEWVGSAKMGMDLKYEFYYKGKLITGNNATGSYRGNRDFEGRYFPVMYDPKLGMSQLLPVINFPL